MKILEAQQFRAPSFCELQVEKLFHVLRLLLRLLPQEIQCMWVAVAYEGGRGA